MTDHAEIHKSIRLTLVLGRFDLSNEKTCQEEVEAHLCEAYPDWRINREHRLSARDVPDFLIQGVAVEVKMNAASPRAIIRQLERYAAHDKVRSLILLSNRAVVLPAEINGKPVDGVSLGRAWL